MSYYIIIRGPLGVGKSTIAKALAERLNGEYVSIDSLLEKYDLDTIEGECIPLKNFVKAQDMILPDVNNKLKQGKVIVFDGNFYHEKQIEHIIETLSAPHYIFTLKARLETCFERDSKRAKAYGQDAARAVFNLVNRFDYGTLIDAEREAPEEIVGDILSHLPKQ